MSYALATTEGMSQRQAAAAELMKRRNARRSLVDFTTYTDSMYAPDQFHVAVANALDRVVSGEVKRLMIFAPPQHGKSRLASVSLPAFWLGKRPNDPVILSSYAADLAIKHSRSARGLVESKRYQSVFGELSPRATPIRTNQSSRKVDEWSLSEPHKGGIRAVGVGGGLTGFPGALGIIDDPLAGWREAQSATQREHVWDWYRSVFRTRIWEGGAIVIIMTRWHEDDLCGRLLQMQPGEWDVLRLPAIAEDQKTRDHHAKKMGLPKGNKDPLGRKPGEPLSPSRYSTKALKDIESDVGSVVWVSLYQGAPSRPEGNRFKRSWFQIVGTAPKFAKRIRYWDKAGTKDGGAYTAGVLVAYHEGVTYIEDVKRGQWSAFEREKIIKQTAEIDAATHPNVKVYIEQEPGSGGKESAESTIANLAGFSVYADRPTGDKDTRMEPFAAQSEANNVKIVRGSWNEDWLDEIAAIPNSTYRDQGDATAAAFNLLFQARDVYMRQGKANF